MLPAPGKKHEPRALLLSTDARCARSILEGLATDGRGPLLVLDLECAELAASHTRAETLVVTTGVFPKAGGGTAPPPTWFEALGHDAALLGAAALEQFSLERVDDARAVAALHGRARAALSRVDVALWTSGARGFRGAQRLARRFSLVEARDLGKVRAP